MAQIYIMGRGSILNGNCRSLAHGVTEQGAGSHDPNAAHRQMGHADISARKEQILHISGIQRPVGDGIGCGGLDIRIGTPL